MNAPFSEREFRLLVIFSVFPQVLPLVKYQPWYLTNGKSLLIRQKWRKHYDLDLIVRVAKRRDYREEENVGRCLRTSSDRLTHPLQSSIVKESKSNSVQTKKQISSAYSDPLSKALEGSDPLSQFVSKDEVDDVENYSMPTQTDDISHEWLKHRTAILGKFTTSEKLSITSSFLQGGEKCM